ncbi:MAG: MBL fold metallo-hydrolase, partial [Candidatus Doudnabacteria bacterium]|nr:MBL fold metallo-hydrolase [Candidatus Doudnabacteria bacterium]
MRIQYIGHAGFIVSLQSGIKILIDPFFHAAFLGSWFPYPCNDFFEEHCLKKYKFDYLYVSHCHEDHFDRKFLEKLDKKVTVLCPHFRSNALARKFRELGFKNIMEIGHQEARHFGTFKATIYLDVSHKEDSGLLLEADGVRFLDLNDCNTKLSDLPRNVTILAAQYSGA